MRIEHPAAFSFIMQDDIYLLDTDRAHYGTSPASIAAEPEAEYANTPGRIIEPQPVRFEFLGGNKKKFLVIVHYPDQDTMHEKHFAALESTLTRLGLSRDDVAILNLAKYKDAEIDALAAFFEIEVLLLLGKDSVPAGMGTLEINKIASGAYPALLTFSFGEMMDSVENKKAFWEQIKQL